MGNRVFTLAEIATLTHSRLIGEATYEIQNVADLESATRLDASFLANPIYDKAMRASSAGVVFVSPSIELIPDRNFLVTEDPSRSFQLLVEAFFGAVLNIFSVFQGIHSTAVIHESASIGKNVTIGPYAVIDKDVVVGDDTTIGSGCYVGFQVSIGKNSFIHPHVTIRERCQIGDQLLKGIYRQLFLMFAAKSVFRASTTRFLRSTRSEISSLAHF